MQGPVETPGLVPFCAPGYRFAGKNPSVSHKLSFI
jgi:hypothetical protein